MFDDDFKIRVQLKCMYRYHLKAQATGACPCWHSNFMITEMNTNICKNATRRYMPVPNCTVFIILYILSINGKALTKGYNVPTRNGVIKALFTVNVYEHCSHCIFGKRSLRVIKVKSLKIVISCFKSHLF